MAKKKKKIELGRCALCKKNNVELMESHIIPKLVYRRIQEFPNSRFRNLYQIKDIYQDGEKKPMMCHECEQFFNKFETPYTNKVLDPYLKGENTKNLSSDDLNNFINSMNWRIIYDDLNKAKSFEDSGHKCIFDDIENKMWEHLDKVRTEKTNNGVIEHLTNHTFMIDDFNYKLPVKELFSPMSFGYCRVNEYGNYFIITCFLGLVFVTEYKPSIYIGAGGFISNITNHIKRSNIKARIKEELLQYAHSTAQQCIDNESILNTGLRDKIRKRYEK